MVDVVAGLGRRHVGVQGLQRHVGRERAAGRERAQGSVEDLGGADGLRPAAGQADEHGAHDGDGDDHRREGERRPATTGEGIGEPPAHPASPAPAPRRLLSVVRRPARRCRRDGGAHTLASVL